MNRLDDLLDQLTVEVPPAPTVDELRSRVGSRHRRLVPVATVLVGLVVVAVVFLRITADDERTREVSAAQRGSESGPLSFAISIRVQPNPLVEMIQFDPSTQDWIPEDFPSAGIRVSATSTSGTPLRLTAPTWEGRTELGITYRGNGACTLYLVCVQPNETVTLASGEEHQFVVYVQPRLAPPDDYSFTTEFGYEDLTTGETGTIPVEVELRIWQPEPGTEPPPVSVTTIMLPLPPVPSTTATL